MTRMYARRLTFCAVIASMLYGCGDDTTQPVVGPAAPSALAVTSELGTLHASWTNASDDVSVRLLRRLNAPPANAFDPAATLVYSGAGAAVDLALTALLPTTAATPRVYHYAVFGCDAAGNCEAVGSRAENAPTIVECLRGGGYTIYWRHAEAGVCIDHTELGLADSTTVPAWWQNCESECALATAQQLSDVGAAQATAIGLDVRARAIPIGRVLTSEFCRCVRTAEYLGFNATIEQDRGLTYFVYGEGGRCAAVSDWIATPPPAGTNMALIGHPIGRCASVPADLAAGEAVISKPDGSGGATFIARVLADEWDTLP